MGQSEHRAFDYKTAVKQAVDSLADEILMLTYPSGHKDSIEVAARRAVLTGVNQTVGRLQVARQSLADFTQATGGRVDSARTSVPKFGRSEASRASAQARKASSTYSSLNTKAKPVTMQSIANVKAFSCDTLDAAGQQQLKNAHKRLLMVASKQPENVEVGRVFDIKMKPLTKDITGSAEGSSVRLPNFNAPYIVIHTPCLWHFLAR